jgi:hypothetical protein
MPTKVFGSVVSGTGTAAHNLQTQLPLIAAGFPEIAQCFPGTLNVKLEKALLVLSPDHRTEPIDWHPDHAPGEIFDILRIQLEAPEGTLMIPACLYIAHNSPHQKDLTMHEVIALKVQVSTGGQVCHPYLTRVC